MNSKVNVIVWIIVVVAVCVPLTLAANSELLQWREPIYIAAGIAGVFAMALLLFQPLLAAGYLPGLTRVHSRRVHRVVGLGYRRIIISISNTFFNLGCSCHVGHFCCGLTSGVSTQAQTTAVANNTQDAGFNCGCR